MRKHPASAILIVLALLIFSAPTGNAGNKSNYLHLINGVDYFYGKGPGSSAYSGIWRCFPSEMLHAPTRVVDPANPLVGKWATKITAMHFTMVAQGTQIQFPTVALTSSTGNCSFLTSSGSANFGLLTVAGVGTIVGGPLTGASGPVTQVNVLAAIPGFTVTVIPKFISQLSLELAPSLGGPSTVAVPEGESLVFWVQDNPTPAPGQQQYWTGSADERNLCSGYSYLLSGGVSVGFLPTFEWGIGLGTLDATATPVISSPTSPAPFDMGTGTTTISITAGGFGNEFLGFAVYDENNAYGGAYRLAVCNVMGYNTGFGPSCNTVPNPVKNPTWVSTPTGGPGGPILSTALAQVPRSVGKFDALSTVQLGSYGWTTSTNHSTSPGGLNIPFFPAAAGISGSNATGIHGGFPIPIPNLAALIGVRLFSWNLAVDGTNSFFDYTGNNGHSLSNGYPFQFFP